MSNEPPGPLTLPPPRPDTGDLLLDAASRLIVERGTLDIGLAEVAAASGVSRPLIRYHFDSADGLLRALAARDATAMSAAIRALLGERATGETIERALAAIVQLHLDRPYGPALLRHAARLGWPEVVGDAARPVFGALREIVKQGEAAGCLQRVAPLLLHGDIIAACDLLFGRGAPLPAVAAELGVAAPTMDELRAHLVERVLAGVRSP